MLAVKQHGFGGREQLSLCELPRPTPKEGFVLVRVAAVSIHAGDHHMLTGRPYLTRLIGLNEIPGMDFSGVVEEVGPGLARFAAGDEVFGTTDTTCPAVTASTFSPALVAACAIAAPVAR